MRVAAEPRDLRQVQRERDAGDRARARRAAARARRRAASPATRSSRAARPRPPPAAPRAAAREQRRRPAVQDGLGGGHRHDEVGLDERPVDRERDAARASELDEIVGLGVVDDHPAAEAPPELGRDEQADLARRRPPLQPAGDEDRHAARRRAARARRRRPRSPRGAGRRPRPGSAATAARSRASPCRPASTSCASGSPASGKRSASRTAAPTSVDRLARRRRPQHDAVLGDVGATIREPERSGIRARR